MVRSIGLFGVIVVSLVAAASARAQDTGAGPDHGLTVTIGEDLQESAEYAVRINTITSGFMDIINRSTGWDDLAYGVREGHVSDEYAQRKSRQLSVELRAAYRRVSDELRALPEPPASAANQPLPTRKARALPELMEHTRA